MNLLSRLLSFTLMFAISVQSVQAGSGHWTSKAFKGFKAKSPNPCEISFVSFMNGKMPAEILDTPKMNMWNPKFSANDFVDNFVKIETKAEQLKALEQLKSLAYKDQDFVNSLSDITNELIRRRKFTVKELRSVFLDNTDTSRVRFYLSKVNKKFVGKVSIDLDKKIMIDQFVESQKLTKTLKDEYTKILMFSSRTTDEFEYAISKGLKLRNDKKSLNRLKGYLDFLDSTKSKQIKKAFKNIDEIYDFSFRHNILNYSTSSLLNPRKRFLIQQSRVANYQKRRVRQIEKQLLKENNGKPLSKMHKSRAANRARGESSILGRLLNGCNGSGGKSLKSAAKKFSRFKLGLSLTATPSFYFMKNRDKLNKDSEDYDQYWFERLGFEVGISLLFTVIGNKIFTSTSSGFWGKYFEGYLKFGALDAGSAYGYDALFGAKGYGAIIQKMYRSDIKETPLEEEYNKLVQSPTFDKDMKDMYAFLEKRSKDINLKNKLNKYFNLYTYKSGDDKNRITQEDLETQEGREVLMELLAEKMYAENMGQWEVFQSGNTGADRWLFYRARNTFWDIKGLVSNLAIFQIMCREPLGKVGSWGLILGIIVANEMLTGPTYQYRREAINQ